MALKSTNLLIQMAQLPPTFKGSPQDLAAEMVRRMKILSPTGTNFIFIGDNEPTSNVGPWLKNGTQWFVWSDSLKRYVPLDISASETRWFFTGPNVPPNSTPPVWLQTTKTPTDADPSIGDPIGWNVFDGAAWVPFNSIIRSGTTAERPAAPVEFQEYYDTDIGVRIWFERGIWRTVSGVPGDVKQVVYELATQALAFNPGWSLFGDNNQNFRGRILVEATKDATGTETVLTVPANVTQRGALETFGTDHKFAVDDATGTVYFPQIALWTLIKT